MPGHRQWRNAPTSVAGNALVARGFVKREVLLAVTARAVRLEMTRIAPPDDRHVFVLVVALGVIVASCFGLFSLGIASLPVLPWGSAPAVPGDATVLVGAVIHPLGTRHMRIKSHQNAHKPALERDSPLM